MNPVIYNEYLPLQYLYSIHGVAKQIKGAPEVTVHRSKVRVEFTQTSLGYYLGVF